MLKRYSGEIPVAVAIAILTVVLAFAAPGYFAPGNLSDLAVANLPVMIVALGMTLVILTGHIDISVGSVFAACAVSSGVIVNLGFPLPMAALASCAMGGLLGAVNGALVAYVRAPSIVVTLAAMIALRDLLRWATGGAWVAGLPRRFQWLGLTPDLYYVFAFTAAVLLAVILAWSLRHLAAGRAVYAAGSNEQAARLAGINVALVTFAVFVITGALAGFAAILNSVRFNQIPSNTGLGLELKVIAAVVVGGAEITGGRGSVAGTVLGIVLLGSIGTALTFLGVSAYWERAIQGAIILAAVAIGAVRTRAGKHAGRILPARA
jgi:rhamnose transport system permease protein